MSNSTTHCFFQTLFDWKENVLLICKSFIQHSSKYYLGLTHTVKKSSMDEPPDTPNLYSCWLSISFRELKGTLGFSTVRNARRFVTKVVVIITQKSHQKAEMMRFGAVVGCTGQPEKRIYKSETALIQHLHCPDNKSQTPQFVSHILPSCRNVPDAWKMLKTKLLNSFTFSLDALCVSVMTAATKGIEAPSASQTCHLKGFR